MDISTECLTNVNMKLIDKDAVVAEIKKKIRTEQGYSSGDAECGYRDFAREILSYLDTLEVKEVDEVVENFAKSKRKELEKMIPGFVDDRKFTDIVLNFYERGIRDGVQMMLERMTDIIAERNATHVSAQMSEAASGKLNDAYNEKNKEDWR